MLAAIEAPKKKNGHPHHLVSTSAPSHHDHGNDVREASKTAAVTITNVGNVAVVIQRVTHDATMDAPAAEGEAIELQPHAKVSLMLSPRDSVAVFQQ